VHRSRLSMLVIFAAAAAACSTRDDSRGTTDDSLSKDPTLVAKLEAGKQTGQPLPAACGTVAIGAQPSDANKAESDELTRKAYDAEMQGNVQQARTLLQRASKLDATNRSAAYHLGLTSETLEDRTTAVTAYCRYLALAPTSTESAEARQRVARLSQTTTRVATGSVSERATNGRSTPVATAPRVASTRRATEPSVGTTAVTRGASQSSMRREPTRPAPQSEPRQTAAQSEP